MPKISYDSYTFIPKRFSSIDYTEFKNMLKFSSEKFDTLISDPIYSMGKKVSKMYERFFLRAGLFAISAYALALIVGKNNQTVYGILELGYLLPLCITVFALPSIMLTISSAYKYDNQRREFFIATKTAVEKSKSYEEFLNSHNKYLKDYELFTGNAASQ